MSKKNPEHMRFWAWRRRRVVWRKVAGCKTEAECWSVLRQLVGPGSPSDLAVLPTGSTPVGEIDEPVRGAGF